MFVIIMTENFPQMNVRLQTSDPGGSENTKQGNCLKNDRQTLIFKLQIIKDKGKILKEDRLKTKQTNKNTLPRGRQR